MPAATVVVQLCAPKLTTGIGTVSVLVGDKNAYCTGPLVLVPFAMHKVVVLAPQPKEKLVVLVALNVGKADVLVTVIVFMVEQPLIVFSVKTVAVPGEQILAILRVPLVIAEGPFGYEEPGLYQNVEKFVVGDEMALVKVGQVELQFISALVALSVLVGTMVFCPIVKYW